MPRTREDWAAVILPVVLDVNDRQQQVQRLVHPVEPDQAADALARAVWRLADAMVRANPDDGSDEVRRLFEAARAGRFPGVPTDPGPATPRMVKNAAAGRWDVVADVPPDAPAIVEG